MKKKQEVLIVDELKKKDLQQAAGGLNTDDPHCPKCQSRELTLVGPADIGTPPTYRCKACGYEWMLAL